MTGVRQVKSGELVALRPGQGDDFGAAVPVRPERPLTDLSEASVDLSNIVPFRRPRAHDEVRDAPQVMLPAGAARAPADPAHERARLWAFALLSVLVHGSLLAFLWREPDPLASIGVQVISVEIVVGADAPAGVAPTPGENEIPAPNARTEPQPADPAQAAVERATEQPQSVPVAKQEAAPDQTSELEQPAAPAPNTDAATKPQPEEKPAVAMVETPQPEIATVKPRAIPPDSMDVTLAPQAKPKPVKTPEPKAAERKVEPKQRVAARPAPAAAPEPARIAAPTKDRASEPARAAAPAHAANNVGLGRSDNDSNYRGLVAAHLARYKQYPADARSRNEGGTAAVAFSLDGGGHVTSVRLARSSGVASIDQEVQAMVRRASPFPPPPNGRPQAFSVPINFSLR